MVRPIESERASNLLRQEREEAIADKEAAQGAMADQQGALLVATERATAFEVAMQRIVDLGEMTDEVYLNKYPNGIDDSSLSLARKALL